MIVWLASYPRSGNTLLRVILHRVFGAKTYSIYDDKSDIGADAALADVVGHTFHGLSQTEFCAKAGASPETFLVKTHTRPIGSWPAIYVVRDVRASVYSLWRYEQTIGGRDTSLEAVIRGQVNDGSWSDHVRSWCLGGRPDTLIARYEDLARSDAATIAAIGEFLDLEPRTDFDLTFDDLKRINPKFFHTGSNAASIEALDHRHLRLIAELHGEVMQEMGYPSLA